MTLRTFASLVALVSLSACGPTSSDPAFVSVEVSGFEFVVFGGECAENRCVIVTAPVDGTKDGEGSCALFGPGDPDDLEPIAKSGPLEMEPGEDTVWQAVLPDDAPPTSDLNPVCQPMSEG